MAFGPGRGERRRERRRMREIDVLHARAPTLTKAKTVEYQCGRNIAARTPRSKVMTYACGTVAGTTRRGVEPCGMAHRLTMSIDQTTALRAYWTQPTCSMMAK